MAATLLVALNLADAWLTRPGGAIWVLELNPLAPPFMTNLVARGLLALALILVLCLMRKQGLLWWLNLAVLGLIGWHWVGNYLAAFAGLTS